MSLFGLGKGFGEIAGNLFGNVVNSAFGRANAKYGAELQKDLWKYQMSNAHQLEVADLRAAGLNPILAATNGTNASMPSVNVDSPKSDYMANHVALKQLKVADKQADIDLINATTAKNKAESEIALNKVKSITERLNWNVMRSQADNIKANTMLIGANIKQVFSAITNQARLTDAQVNQLNALAYQASEMVNIQSRLADARTALDNSSTDYNKKLVASLSKEADVMMDKFKADYLNSPVGETLAKMGYGFELMFPFFLRPSMPHSGPSK